MLCVKALIFAVLVVHLEGHQLEDVQASMSAQEVVRDLYGWKKESDTKLAALETEIQQMKLAERQRAQNLEKSLLPPVGFIYIQYGSQSAPSALWPGAIWESVTHQYAGVFFRAEGGHSMPFGHNQRESMRTFNFDSRANIPNEDTHGTMPYDGDFYVAAGGNTGRWIGFSMRYNQNFISYASRDKDNEVRPFNQAVRIWKRTA
jgi:hypothetical protein